MTPWTEERTERLKALIGTMSASQIAADLGGVTRNAVVGKAHRLGLSLGENGGWRPRPVAPRKPLVKPWTPAVVVVEPHDRTERGMQVADRAKDIEVQQEYSPPGRLLTLFDLSTQMLGGTCRWPIGTPGEPDFGFCGGQALSTGVYCPHHHAVAFTGRTAMRRPYGA